MYKLAFEVAPKARNEDLLFMKDWINPQQGETSIDVAAGTGFLTIPLSSWTKGKTYAIDPSIVQLKNLNSKKGDLNIIEIEGSLSEDKTIKKIEADIGKIDIITSYGGLHHVVDKENINKQKKLFENASLMLKDGGRMIVGDVGDNTPLSKHFEMSVKKHCLTGHTEKWINKERLQGELIEGTDLSYIKSEIIPIKWYFENEEQMALFMKCLHAYDMSCDEILKDLSSFLGYTKKSDESCELNWPMLFFHLEKKSKN